MVYEIGKLNFVEKIGVGIVKAGRIPRHVAIIMDGNRRYARRDGLPTKMGHNMGYKRLIDTMKWCLDLDIQVLTMYSFSIENFKRPPEEVESLINLTYSKFTGLLNDIDTIHSMGVRITVAGLWSMVRPDLQELFAKITLATRHNKNLLVNIAFAYTGRDEMCRAASKLISGVESNQLRPHDVTEDLMTQTLDIGPADLLIRTSGETRLSDFLLWQMSDTVISFNDVLWPEWGIWNFVTTLLHYQMHAPPQRHAIRNNERQKRFLKQMEERMWNDMENYKLS